MIHVPLGWVRSPSDNVLVFVNSPLVKAQLFEGLGFPQIHQLKIRLCFYSGIELLQSKVQLSLVEVAVTFVVTGGAVLPLDM